MTVKRDNEQLLDCLKILLQQTKIEFIENDISFKSIRISKLIWDYLNRNIYYLSNECILFSFTYLKNIFFIFSQNLSKSHIKIHNEY